MEKENSENKLIRIAIVGPESTGKSTLAQELAKHFNTCYVPEVAREYLNKLGRKYEPKDIEIISRLQIERENEMASLAKTILICDTNLLVNRIWFEFVYSYCPDWIIQECIHRHYDLHLLLYPDTVWEPDPLREHPKRRMELFELYVQLLDKLGREYYIVRGLHEERLANAVKGISLIKY